MEDLLNMVPATHPTEIICYADDVMILGTGIDEQTIVDNLKRDIQMLERWAERHKLNFSPHKTKMILFTRRRIKVQPTLKLNNTRIEWVDSFKYLGMILDSKLNWTQHIKKTLNKATLALVQCRKLLGQNWGLKPKVTNWIYTAIVRPTISYGALVWAHRLDDKWVIKNLNKLQRRACLMITNASCSTPTAGMEAILALTPLNIKLKENALTSYHRMKQQNTWKTRDGDMGTPGHGPTVMKWAREIPQLEMPADKLKNKVRLERKFFTIIKDRQEIEPKDGKPMPEEIDTIHCFTDGSKTEDRSGAGYIIKGGNLKKHGYKTLGNTTTVFQAEISAIIEASEKLIEEIRNQIIKIMIDSQSAIKALKNFTTTDSLVLQCKTSLNKLGETNTVTLYWIPGHKGHMGNEVADRLAKRGADSSDTPGPFPLIPVPKSHPKQLIREWGHYKHNIEWLNRKDCRQTKMMIPIIPKKPLANIFTKSKSRIRRAVQLLTGHNNLNRHRFLMKMEESPKCTMCGEGEETSEHYIAKCPAYARQRLVHLGRAILKQSELAGLRLRDIMKFTRETGRLED